MNKIYQGDCLEFMKELDDNSVDSVVTDPPYGWNFMNKKWDKGVPQVKHWKEVMRVLKPGGHILVACGTRTQHRMATNIEDAGFEIRDLVAWVYGSGFPKSHNIGKAVDKLQGNKGEVVGKHPYANRGSAQSKQSVNLMSGSPERSQYLDKGNSPWEGWGTALKPAMELWTLARNPLSEKTIAENVLKWGTGGMNIDGCRINHKENLSVKRDGHKLDTNKQGWGFKAVDRGNQGRFPANLIHDGSKEVVGMFPDSKGGYFPQRRGASDFFGLGDAENRSDFQGRMGDSGSAARFFYCPKASKSERNKGLEGFEKKIGGGMSGTQDKTLKTGSGNERNNMMKNNHPTVKPIDLMRYLCRLITPPKGIVLDPYLGSGTTAIATKLEGFKYIGIEVNQDYVNIARARIKAWHRQEKLFPK